MTVMRIAHMRIMQSVPAHFSVFDGVVCSRQLRYQSDDAPFHQRCIDRDGAGTNHLYNTQTAAGVDNTLTLLSSEA